ncbi:MAG: peptidylprolyl isomerase [Microbacteriaceae bacterium]
MASKNSDRESRNRLRTYQARTQVNDEQRRRRKRDNLWASIAVAAIFTLAVVGQLAYFGSGPGAPQPTATAATNGEVPDVSLSEGREWTGTASVGEIPVEFTLDGVNAPQAAASEISLIQSGFYENNSCHRLTTSGIFVLQCGDPNGDGTGGPGYSYGPVENAPADNVYPAGTIAMARQGGNASSMGSQFFIVYQDSTIPADEAGGYTVVGHITSGLTQLQARIALSTIADGSTDGTPTPAISISNVTIK